MVTKIVRLTLLFIAMLLAVKITATVPYDNPTPQVLPKADSEETVQDPVIYSNRIEAIK
jgi:hypothetical protein